MSGTDLKTVAEEAAERSQEAVVELRLAEMFGDHAAAKDAQRRGVTAALDLANALRAGAPVPHGLPEEGVEDFLADYPEDATVESLILSIQEMGG
jgi:hypothetical protein